ncbi:type VI secretion system Vgr family protein [Dyadobacter sp. CY343]|uniref:type VI secretion system Vgr family protein n=1 Tax=Dyadobacter sp. CY343 TaxID=2907299 RepID=UPI001F41D90C|nr:phage baseplate assembly protein V [Dyadobacter sp. CY343]MCE7062914.1 phage baseplate assembly protein V [Dyadobacter sp. CY343]
MARQVNTSIEIEGGVQITRHLGLVIEQDLFAHHWFELLVPFDQLEDAGEHFFNKAHRAVMGKKITFSFSPRLGQESFDFTFQGIVTEIRLRSLSDMSSAFVLKGYSPTIVMEDSVQRRSFLRGTVQDIFNAVLQPYPQNLLRKQLNPENGGRAVPFTQYNESNYKFLSRVADRCCEWFYYNGRELVLGHGNGGAEVDFLVDGLQNFDVALKLQPAAFSFEGYNYTVPEAFTGQSAQQQVDGLTSLSEFALEQSDTLFAQTALLPAPEIISGQSEVDELTKMERSARVTSMVDFRGSGETPTISVGTVLAVKGQRLNERGEAYEENFGKYRVVHIRHEINTAGSYQNSFNAVPESAQHPPNNPFVTNPLGETEQAEVIANDDTDQLGRVRVKFFWSQSRQQDQESIWMRVGTMHNSQGRGTNFVPEIGAMVMIGYEGNLAENPFVLTSLYPKPEEDIAYTSDNNDVKIIATRSGNMVVFLDKDGDAKIQISNRNKLDTFLQFSFKDDGEIKMQVENGLVHIKCKDLNVEASNNISMNANSSFDVQAGQISMKASQDIKLESGTATDIKAGTELNAESTASANIKGATMTVEGDASTDIKSSGLINVQGSLIKLN